MKLRIFLPATDRPEAGARIAWMLFDARHALLRQDISPLADIPRAEQIEAVLPASRVLFARLRLPRVNAATIRQLLPFAVEDRLLADPSHIHAVAGRVNARGETVVAVLDREWLQAMLEALARFGLRPDFAWSEGALLAGDGGEWNLVLGKERGMLVDPEGVGVTFDRSAATAFPLALRIALDEASARGERPQAIRVHPEAAEPLPDLAQWGSEASIEFTAGPPWERLAAGASSAHAINLLQGDFAPPRPARLGRIPAGAALLAVLIGALQLAFVGADYGRLARERSALEARREALFRSAFPEARVVVDPELQMARNLSQLRRERGIAADDEFLENLTRAARAPGGPARSIDYANGRLEVRRGAPAPMARAQPPIAGGLR